MHLSKQRITSALYTHFEEKGFGAFLSHDEHVEIMLIPQLEILDRGPKNEIGYQEINGIGKIDLAIQGENKRNKSLEFEFLVDMSAMRFSIRQVKVQETKEKSLIS